MNNNQVKKFIIVRERWLRGSTITIEDGSTLRDEYDHQCCLGFYGDALNVDYEQDRSPCHSHNKEDASWPEWLFTEDSDGKLTCPSTVQWNLIDTNDSKKISEEAREAKIKQIFALQGVEVEFI